MSEIKSYTTENQYGIIEYREPQKTKGLRQKYIVSMNYIDFPEHVVLSEGETAEQAIEKGLAEIVKIPLEVLKFL